MRPRAIDQSMHPLKIRALDALGLAVRVADLVLDDSMLATDYTLRRHGNSEGW
jgi:hypothetical protein